MKIFSFLFAIIFFYPSISRAQEFAGFKGCIVLAEQSQNRIAIADTKTNTIIWDWKPAGSNVKPEHIKWFNNPSEVKVIYDGKYILMCASGGACALIRISDKKTMFYVYSGENPHSAEILPDGNIACASSSDNRLTVFKTDTLSSPEGVIQSSVFLRFAHNVVWDRKRSLLWTGCMDKIISWRYNFNCSHPALAPVDSLVFNDEEGHDLFPVPGKDALYFSSGNKTWIFDIPEKKLSEIITPYKGIKSLSSEAEGKLPIIIIPKEQWWTDEIINLEGETVFHGTGLKIYKARWITENLFSYPPSDKIKICK